MKISTRKYEIVSDHQLIGGRTAPSKREAFAWARKLCLDGAVFATVIGPDGTVLGGYRRNPNSGGVYKVAA